MTSRLPLAGLPLAGTSDVWPLARDPGVLARSIAVVRGSERAPDGFAEQLARAANELGVPMARLRVAVGVERDPVPAGEGTLRAAPAAMGRAVEMLLSGAPKGAMLVLEGVPFVALRRPTLAVLVDGGAGPLALDAPVRDVRSRFDLVLPEPRPALARELVRRLAASPAAT